MMGLRKGRKNWYWRPPGRSGKVILKLILQKRGVKLWTRF